MKDNGWIKLHRKILENPVICKDADCLAIWVYILLSARHTEKDVIFGGKRITLLPGQLTTGRRKIAEVLNISESKVQRVLKMLKSEQQIEQRTDGQCRLITINNWIAYQQSEQRNEQRVNNDRTTSEQRVNTKQEGKNERKERMKEIIVSKDTIQAAPDFVDEEEKEYGNKEINNMLLALLRFTGRQDFKEPKQKQRWHVKHILTLLDRIGKDEFRRRLTELTNDAFKIKHCSSLRYIYGELKAMQSETPALGEPKEYEIDGKKVTKTAFIDYLIAHNIKNPLNPNYLQICQQDKERREKIRQSVNSIAGKFSA